MSRFTEFRRVAAATGATGLIALSLAGPAAARPDPSHGELSRCTTGCFVGGGDGLQGPGYTPEPTGIAYLPLGAGMLAGIVLAGAGAAVVSRRGHAHAAQAT